MAAETGLRVVLDTNVLLDWLVFAEPKVAGIASGVTSGQVRWLACPSMRVEFERTLGYGKLARWQPDRELALAAFDRHAELVAQPATLPYLRCTDPDDQVFLDLAVATDAGLLLTHDRALLRLARGAARLGVKILRPRDWQSA
jgi:putative PIN family toxin of toxin-antitoxin system